MFMATSVWSEGRCQVTMGNLWDAKDYCDKGDILYLNFTDTYSEGGQRRDHAVSTLCDFDKNVVVHSYNTIVAGTTKVIHKHVAWCSFRGEYRDGYKNPFK